MVSPNVNPPTPQRTQTGSTKTEYWLEWLLKRAKDFRQEPRHDGRRDDPAKHAANQPIRLPRPLSDARYGT